MSEEQSITIDGPKIYLTGEPFKIGEEWVQEVKPGQVLPKMEKVHPWDEARGKNDPLYDAAIASMVTTKDGFNWIIDRLLWKHIAIPVPAPAPKVLTWGEVLDRGWGWMFDPREGTVTYSMWVNLTNSVIDRFHYGPTHRGPWHDCYGNAVEVGE